MKQSYSDEAREIIIELEGGKRLRGLLHVPKGAKALVIFAHGSGSSRLSKRNQYVAECMAKRGLGTLLFDLLTQEEEVIDDITREYRFDIVMLGERLAKVISWVGEQEDLRSMQLGCIGSSTGAAAALIGASLSGGKVKAVVSRGGRPDLAEEVLGRVTAPTLLIVGGLDDEVIDLNRQAKAKMSCKVELTIVDGATHLFEEEGTLEAAAMKATEWFLKYLA